MKGQRAESVRIPQSALVRWVAGGLPVILYQKVETGFPRANWLARLVTLVSPWVQQKDPASLK